MVLSPLGDRGQCVVKHPRTGAYYHLGAEEHFLLTQLDGRRDTEAIQAAFAERFGHPRGESRWRLALCGLEMLLEDLGLELDAKRAIIRQARDRFAKEFRVDANLKHQLGDRYRRERRSLEAHWNSVHTPDGPLHAGLEILRQRSARLAPAMAELKACAQAGALTLSVEELALSYLHMHANRLLRSAQRAQELVLYDFLNRYYESLASRTSRSDRSNTGLKQSSAGLATGGI